ncbi:hypothetical protein D7I39_11140 [Allopusillimonas ginsengisoli]|nr:hypothetical protein D7I39_11140 [Allopusillimonas ginsengisoli]
MTKEKQRADFDLPPLPDTDWYAVWDGPALYGIYSTLTEATDIAATMKGAGTVSALFVERQLELAQIAAIEHDRKQQRESDPNKLESPFNLGWAAGWSACIRAQQIAVQPSVPEGWQLVPVEPTPTIIANAALAAWPTASKADIEMARHAASIVLMSMDAAPGYTLESVAAGIATMAPAYRAMLAAAPPPPAACRTQSSPLEDYMAKVQPLIREDGTIALSDLKTLMQSTSGQAQQERLPIAHREKAMSDSKQMLTDTQIDQHIDQLLVASGSSLKNYSMQHTIDRMRTSMRDAERAVIEAFKRRLTVVGYATPQNEPLVFPTFKEAAVFCSDDEEPVPLMADFSAHTDDR